MTYNFDDAPSRLGTDSIKWNVQENFGVKSGLLPYWIADTDYAVLPEITQALQERCRHPVFGYADYNESVLNAISGWYLRRHRWDIPRNTMFLGGGVVTAIWFTLQAVTQPGDRVMVMTPVYDAFFGVIKNAHRVRVDCPLIRSGNRYSIDFDKMEHQFKSGVRVLLLCNPHNPVGRVWTREELSVIATLCKKYNVIILSDEVHGDLALFGHSYTPMGTIEQSLDRLVVYTSITKTFNMAGLGSSCLIIPNPDLLKSVQHELYGAWLFGPSALAFPAIEAAYTHGDRWVDELLLYIENNVRHTQDVFAQQLPRTVLTDIEGTFLLWVDFSCLGLSSEELCLLMAEKYQLALGKGISYGSEGEGFMRLNVGCTRNILDKGLDLLSRLYQDNLPRCT